MGLIRFIGFLLRLGLVVVLAAVLVGLMTAHPVLGTLGWAIGLLLAIRRHRAR